MDEYGALRQIENRYMITFERTFPYNRQPVTWKENVSELRKIYSEQLNINN